MHNTLTKQDTTNFKYDIVYFDLDTMFGEIEISEDKFIQFSVKDLYSLLHDGVVKFASTYSSGEGDIWFFDQKEVTPDVIDFICEYVTKEIETQYTDDQNWM